VCKQKDVTQKPEVSSLTRVVGTRDRSSEVGHAQNKKNGGGVHFVDHFLGERGSGFKVK